MIFLRPPKDFDSWQVFAAELYYLDRAYTSGWQAEWLPATEIWDRLQQELRRKSNGSH